MEQQHFFRIQGRCPSKKNRLRIKWRGRPRPLMDSRQVFKYLFIGPDADYAKWEKGAAKELMVQKVAKGIETIEGQVEIGMKIYLSTKSGRIPDISNMIQSIEDTMEKAGIIKDDSQICRYTNATRIMGVPEGLERIDIFLTELEPKLI